MLLVERAMKCYMRHAYGIEKLFDYVILKQSNSVTHNTFHKKNIVKIHF